MIYKIRTYADLLEILQHLSPKQLQQEVRVSKTETVPEKICEVESLEEDYINPSGEGAEPKSYYMPGHENYNEEDGVDVESEEVVWQKDTVFLNIQE